MHEFAEKFVSSQSYPPRGRLVCARPETATMSHRILLVDDEVDILEFVRYNLVREGYEVYTAQR